MASSEVMALPVMMSRNLAHRRKAVFLVGFMGAGKTTVGEALAHRLGWRFADLDQQVEARERRSIAQIFAESGEEEFRQAETRALEALLKALKDGDPTVVALGGGAFAQAANAALLKSAGVRTVFLDAPMDALWQRCAESDAARPLRRDQQAFKKLYEERKPHYLSAEFHVETGNKSPSEVMREIQFLLGEQS